MTWKLALSIFTALLGSFQFGYNTGVINAPESIIKSFINETHIERSGSSLVKSEITPIWSILVAIFAVGGMIGALMTGIFSEYFGRKRGMSVNCIFGLMAGVLMFASYYAKSYEMIIVGRLIVGFNSGLYTGLVPIYLTEIASHNIRGALGTAHQLGVTVGITVSQIFGFNEVLGTHAQWNILLGITAIPAILQFVLFLFCPESPKYLLIARRNSTVAADALQQFRGSNNVEDEIDEMKDEVQQNSSAKQETIVSLLCNANLRWPVLIAVMMQMSQQLSGINAVIYYSSSLLQDAGLSKYTASHATSAVGGVLVVMTAVSIPLMDHAGRRPLHLFGLLGMFLSTIIITFTLVFKEHAHWISILSIVILLLYVISFAIGPGSIPWFIVSEMFMYSSRASAMSIAIAVNWVSNFLVGFTFPYIEHAILNYSFLPFTALLIIFIIFLYMFLPETKNRSYLEITESLHQRFRKPERSSLTYPVGERQRLIE